jgi:hypothetical protein
MVSKISSSALAPARKSKKSVVFIFWYNFTINSLPGLSSIFSITSVNLHLCKDCNQLNYYALSIKHLVWSALKWSLVLRPMLSPRLKTSGPVALLRYTIIRPLHRRTCERNCTVVHIAMRKRYLVRYMHITTGKTVYHGKKQCKTRWKIYMKYIKTVY